MPEKMKIILICRDADMLEMMKGLLEGEGYHIETVVTQAGEKGNIEKIKRFCPDLAVLDVSAPGLFDSDFEKTEEYRLLEAIKVCRETTEVPVVIVIRLVEVVKKAEKFLGKRVDSVVAPFNVEDFLNTIKKVAFSSK